MSSPFSLVDAATGSSGTTLVATEVGDRLGLTVAPAGDFNGDGIDDFLVGALPSVTDPVAEVYLVLGREGGLPTDLSVSGLAGGEGGFLLVAGGAFDGAVHMAGAGDVNGDGLADILIGAPGADAADGSAADAGAAFLLYGTRDLPAGTVDVRDHISAGGGVVIAGTVPGETVAKSVAFAGDINGDGFDDILLGSDYADAVGAQDAGRVWVVFGGDALPGQVSLAAVSAGDGGFVLEASGAFDGVGAAVASAGDLNGDGLDDILIGAPGDDGSGNAKGNAGAVYVVFGRPEGFEARIALESLAESAGFVIRGRIAGQQVGKALAAAGDINDDGFADILIGVPDAGGYNNLPSGAGEVYVLFGRDGGFGAAIDLGRYGAASTASDGFMIYGRDAYDSLGYAVAGIGDLNGDGIDDILVGAIYGDGPNSSGDSGEVYAIYGHRGSWAPTVNLLSIQQGDGGFVAFGRDTGDSAGMAVAGIGDVNADGLPDIAVGAAFADGPANGAQLAGEAYVLYGSAVRTAAAAADDAVRVAEGALRLQLDVLGNDEAGATLVSTGVATVSSPDPLIDAQDVGASIVQGRLQIELGPDFAVLSAGQSVTVTLPYAIRGSDGLAGEAIVTLTILGSDGEGVLIDLRGPGGGTGVGGRGDDVFLVDDAADTVIDGPGGGIDTVRASIDWTLGENLENLELQGSANVRGTGNTLGNRITGNSGDNTLDGGAGVDTLVGGTGSDTFFVDDGADVVIETTGEAGTGDSVRALASGDAGPDSVGDVADSLRSSAPSYTLPVGVENGLLLAGAAAGGLRGNPDGNLLEGNAAANQLRGAAGSDTLSGGEGSDVAVFAGGRAGYRVETLPDGTLRVTDTRKADGDDGVDLLSGIEVLRFADRVETVPGTTTVAGGAGADVLDLRVPGAQAGIGAGGNDVYQVDSTADALVELADGGRDRVESSIDWTLWDFLEDLRLTGEIAVTGRGNEAANLIEGNGVANRLYGEAGNDTLVGAAGADTLDGGSGNDRYAGVTAEDVLVEAASGGIDLVETALDWTLGDAFENLVLSGSEDLDGTGNAAANRITGNAGLNRLSGGEGNDTLIGGAGADTLDGGNGNDRYVVTGGDVILEAAKAGTDTVEARSAWTLGSALENLVLTGSANARAVGNDLPNRIVGNDGDNQIAGGRGADTLTGGAGADRFVFDTAPAAGSADRVMDFDPAADALLLSRTVFTALPAGALAPEAFRAGAGLSVAESPQDRILYDSTGGALYYDPDGSGVKAALRIAVLVGAPALGAEDIFVG